MTASATHADPRTGPVRVARPAPRRLELSPASRRLTSGTGPTGRATVGQVIGEVGQLVDDTDGHRIIRHRLRADDHAGNRLFLVLLFWGMLITSVALWAFDTAPGSVNTTADIAIAGGRITGMIAGFVLLTQVVLASRVAWLEQTVGGRVLMRWHRYLGSSLLVFVLAHAALITYGYALSAKVPVTQQAVSMLALKDMVSATVATGILIVVAFTAIKAIRKLVKYEIWHVMHMAAYAALVLGYGHQFALGANLTDGFAYWYWSALYAGTVAALLWGRVIDPAWFNLKHRLRVAEVVPEAPDTFSVYLTGRRLEQIEAKGGQYFRWRFLNRAGWWQSHPFSLSMAPNGEFLRITVAMAGDHTRELRNLRPGTAVLADGPSGTFTADHRVTGKALLVAVGSGIGPIRAICEEMPTDTLMIYRARTEADLALKKELDDLAVTHGLRIRYVLGSRNDREPRELFTAAGLGRVVPDIAERDVYLCGPGEFSADLVAMLQRLRVPGAQIHQDPFSF